MITRKELCTVIKVMRGEVHPMEPIHHQLLLSLTIYKQRKEWDGSVDSAIQCLRQAQYEINDARVS